MTKLKDSGNRDYLNKKYNEIWAELLDRDESFAEKYITKSIKQLTNRRMSAAQLLESMWSPSFGISVVIGASVIIIGSIAFIWIALWVE